jgi:hypothetical protein
MPKFTFKCEHEGLRTDDVVITNTTEFRGETLDEVLENFERFLKGSGYIFDGQLDFVKEDELGMRDDYSEEFEMRDDYSEEFEKHGISINVPPLDSAAWPFPLNERPS